MSKKLKSKLFNWAVYTSLGISAYLSLFLLLYWSLRLNSSISNLVRNYYNIPLYFWPYVILTLGTLVLFGLNVPLLVFRWRKYGFPKLKSGAGTSFGALIGVLASACPICGSTLLSLIGITGGLAVFPFAGLELKAASFALMALPIFLTSRELKRFASGVEECPVPKDPSFKLKKHKPFFIALLGIIFVLGFVVSNMLATDPIFFRVPAKNSLINRGDNRLYKRSLQSQGLYEASQVRKVNNPIYDEVVAKGLPPQTKSGAGCGV